MVDVDTRPQEKQPDRTTRRAALWATVIAVPIAVLVGVVFFMAVKPPAPPAAAPTTPAAIPSAAVLMTAPELSARDAQVCLALTSQLPPVVRDLKARPVSAGPEQNAAYGEPPLTVACGVAKPKMCTAEGQGGGCVPLTADLLTMNRVCWYGAPAAIGTIFTTMDREVAVQVTVPSGLENPAQWANEFSDTVVKTVKSTTVGVPSGCLF